MVIFDFIVYKVYKLVLSGKQYKGIEEVITACILAFPLTILVSTIINNIGKIFNLEIVDFVYKLGRIPFYILFSVPLIIIILFYLNRNLRELEYRISTNSILKKIDKLPNFIIYLFFAIINLLFSILINEITNKYLQ